MLWTVVRKISTSAVARKKMPERFKGRGGSSHDWLVSFSRSAFPRIQLNASCNRTGEANERSLRTESKNGELQVILKKHH